MSVPTISAEVSAALAQPRAVVALETTILSHGLPWPRNYQLAEQLERAVRGCGAVPAWVAVIAGKARVGLSLRELEQLSRDTQDTRKASAADLGANIALGCNASTTVSASVTLASLAGIRVFATGGIGGVHRGDSGDVSCDLHTLAGTSIAVVASGAKSILDLPRTLEALESLGILVCGYQTAAFPAFYCRSSGLELEHRVESVCDLAQVVRVRLEYLRQAAVLVCNPVPSSFALDPAVVEPVISEALRAACEAHVVGKALTPFLLENVARRLGESALAANCALAVSNATLAAELSKALTSP